MTKYLTIDDMLDALVDEQSLEAPILIKLAETVANVIAEALNRRLSVKIGDAEFAPRPGRLCVSFAPFKPDQPCPETLKQYDPGNGKDDDNWTEPAEPRKVVPLPVPATLALISNIHRMEPDAEDESTV